MKVTGVLVALAAAAPMVSAMPFRLADVLSPRAPAREHHEPTFPDVPHIPHVPHHNLTARGVPANLTARDWPHHPHHPHHPGHNETHHDKRAFIPQARSGEKGERSFWNGHPGHHPGHNGTWPHPGHGPGHGN